MALYTLKSRDEALLPLANYNGDNTWIRNQLSSLGYAPTPAQTQVYSALGRTTGAEGNGGSNFFEKRGRSIENALGTTGAAVASFAKDTAENMATDQLRRDNKNSMNDIAKKYGYNSWSDWQDAYYAAKDAGDTAKVAEMEPQLKEFQAQANTNAAKADKKAADYKDYRENNYISQKINQDRGKFAGSAINTLSTAVDVTGLASNPLSNAIQGGVEGLADELEQNGLENFSWERAGQNALIGATTGAVTGALNKGISSSLAKNGGNLFKGGNALTRGLNNLGSKTALGRVGSTLATGAARGAVSGAVGGATGAGLQSALNGVEFGQGVQNALQGAVQGAQQGAVTGGIMAGANMAISKTPGVGKFYNELQGVKNKWDQSGRNFDERLTNTLTSGDSAVGDWLMNKRQSNVLGAAGNLGNRIQDTQGMYRTIDPFNGERTDYTPDEVRQLIREYENYEAPDILSGNSSSEVAEALGDAGVTLSEIYAHLNGGQFNPYSRADGEAFNKWVQQTKADLSTPTTAKGWAKKAGEQRADGGITEDITKRVLSTIAEIDPNATMEDAYAAGWDLLDRSNNLAELRQNMVKEWGAWMSPEDVDNVLGTTPTTAKGWAKKAGQRIVEDLNNSNLGNRVKDVSSNMPEDIRNMQIRDYNVDADGQNSSRPYEYIGANGKKALKIEMPILNDVPAEESSAFIKQAVMDLAQEGRLLNVGDIPEMADISRNSSRKLGGNAGWSDTQLRQRNEVIADINEVGDYLHNVRYEAPKAGSRDNVAGVIKGDVEIDINGEKIYPEVVYRLYDNGDLVLHDVTKINRLPSGNSSDRNLGRQYRLSEATKQPSDTSIVTQNNQNVNVTDPWDRVAQEAGYSNYDEVLQRYAEANPNAEINPRGMAGQVLTWMDQNPNTPTTAAGWAKRAGQRAVEDVNNSNLGLRVQDVSQDDPSKRLYNALVGNQEPVATAKANTLPEANMGVEEATAKTSKAGKLRNAAGLKYAAQYGTIDKPTAKATNPAKTFTELAELGFTKPADVERMAGAMTGSNGEMSALVRNVVNAADPVDTFAGEKSGQTLDDYINLSIQKHGLDGIREGKAVKSQIDALMGSLPSHAEGSIDFQDTPEAVFKLTQQLDAEAANYRGKSGMNYGTTTPDKLRAAQVISDVSGLLKDRIYSNSDVKQALTPEVAQNLKSYAPNNKAWAKYVDETVMNMENVKDLRSAQANWVNANKIIDNAYVNSMTYGGRVGGSGSIPLTKRGLAGAILDKTINSDTGLRAQAKLLNKAADFVDNNPDTNATANPDTAAGWAKQAGKRAAEDLGNTNLGNRIQDVSGAEVVNPQIASPAELATMTADYNPSTQLYNAIGRTEGLTNAEQANTADYLVDAVQEAEVVPSTGSTLPASTGSTALYSSLAGTPTTTTQTTTGTGYFQPTGDYWTDILASAMSRAIDADDVNAFSTLYGMYQDALANTSKSTGKDYTNPMNWSSADRTKLLSAQNAMGQIDQLEEAYNQATGENGGNAVQGWLRSRASDISGGNWDPSASNYNSLSESVGMGIVKNLINLGVTEADAERYLKYLPALTDTKEQAAQKLDTLRSIYQNQINNLYGAYGV